MNDTFVIIGFESFVFNTYDFFKHSNIGHRYGSQNHKYGKKKFQTQTNYRKNKLFFKVPHAICAPMI